MQQKKFLLFDTVVGLSNVFQFTTGFNNRYKYVQIGDDFLGPNATATAALDLAGLGGGFCHFVNGENIGSDLTTNGVFDMPLGGIAWDYGANSPNDGAIFVPSDYNVQVVNGQLKMRTYSGTPNAPYAYQNITVGPTLNFNVVINFPYSQDFVNGTTYSTNVFQFGQPPIVLPEGSQPYISIGGVSKKISDGARFNNSSYDNQDNQNEDRLIVFTEKDFEGTGIQPGDTVELRIQMREDLTGTNPLDLEFHFDSIEVFSAEDGLYTGKIFTNYEENASIGFEGVQESSKVIEDLTTVFDSFSEAGSNFNRQPSFVKVSDLDLNATLLGMTPER